MESGSATVCIAPSSASIFHHHAAQRGGEPDMMAAGDSDGAPASPTPVITVHLDPDRCCYEKEEVREVFVEEHKPTISPDSNDYDPVNDFDDEGENIVDVQIEESLDPGEKDGRLDFWQDQIKQNVRGSYYTVGEALYRVLHTERLLKTAQFIQWAHQCFGLTRSTAYEYIRAFRIVKLLQDQDSSLPVPSTLSHFRVFNKTKLKDGGVEVARLWRSILSELPADSNQKPRTAKEVLAKGKEIMEREKLGEHAQRMNGLLPSRQREPLAVSPRGGRVQTPHYPANAAGWERHEPSAKRGASVAAGSLGDVSTAPPLFRPGVPTDDVRALRLGRSGTASASAAVAVGFEQAHMQQQHQQQQQGASASVGRYASGSLQQRASAISHSRPTTRRRQQQQLQLQEQEHLQQQQNFPNTWTTEPADDSGEPPALIRIADKPSSNVIQVSYILDLSQNVIRRSNFDLSLTSAQTQAESKALAQRGTRYRQNFYRPGEKWRGRLWGNFSGPLADEEMDVDFCINRAVEKFDSGEFDEAILLTNVEFGQDWFQKLLQYPQCFLKKYVESPARRNNVVTGNGADGDVVHHTCVVFYLGTNVQKFVEQFRQCGTIPGVNTWCNYSSD